MNDGQVWSIFLCSFYYVMILLLFWGHEPCIGFFLQRFNMLDALICYPGSIEKLKLLGATYLLHYKSTRPALMRTKNSQNEKTQPHDNSSCSAAPPAFTDE
jgi:hypothetical protein